MNISLRKFKEILLLSTHFCANTNNYLKFLNSVPSRFLSSFLNITSFGNLLTNIIFVRSMLPHLLANFRAFTEKKSNRDRVYIEV